MVERLQPLLRRSGYRIHRARGAVAIPELLWSTACDLLIVNHPVNGVGLADLVATVRDRTSPSRDSRVVLIVPDDQAEAAARWLTSGVNRLVPRGLAAELLLDAVGDLIDVSPRQPVRAMVQVESRDQNLVVRTLTRTWNLSLTGMLVQDGQELPVGTCLEFELHLPGEEKAIVGSATVMRRTDRVRDPVPGVGVRFASFVDDGRASLAAYLDREGS